MDSPDWLESTITGWLGLKMSSGDILIAALQLLLAIIITAATLGGVFYAARQFRTANTIRYLEEYRARKMKRAVDRVRAADRKCHHWRSYGMLTHIMDYRTDAMQFEAPPLGWSAGASRMPDEDDKARFRNAARLKYISNYFDYVGLLVRSGSIDKDLFFRQLCDVTISNWRCLQPYIYYQRLAIRHGSAAVHLGAFEAAAQKLPDRAAQDLRAMIKAYGAFGPLNGVGAQLWFEWLYHEAMAWRRGRGAEDDRTALRRRARLATWVRRLDPRLGPGDIDSEGAAERAALMRAIENVAD